MRARCNRVRHPDFHWYGGRGIKVCKNWDSFQNFLLDMEPTYRSGLTLERKDVNGDYVPGNCKWATWKEQQRNKRNNHRLTALGKTCSVVEWSESTGIPYRAILSRINMGWTDHQALTTPTRKGSSKYRGVFKRNEKWISSIYRHGKRHWLGTFRTEEQASLAYNEANTVL